MKKELKEYLHLYLGCQFVMKIDNPNSEHHGQLTAPMYFGSDVLHAALCKGDYKIDPILILRPLSSMTEEEQDQVWYGEEPNSILEMKNGTKVRKVVLAPERTAYLLSKGFDLFGLIDSGLAVNAETLK